ncbi:MAG: hypothetical protein MK033_11365 [Candidatus Caenarcaniphilales bacterium]|nr:hypothetical protein [Candidatus Caenarcaniphilales bacterium]
MSEYQYYEFQAIDKALTPSEQKQIAKISSRVQLTSRTAVFTYNYKDLPVKPESLLTKYYDAFFYLSNWGKRLMFKLPLELVDPESLEDYVLDNHLEIKVMGSFIVLDIDYYKEEAWEDWVEDEGWLSLLLGLRAEILDGDYRSLYIAWLILSEIADIDLDTVTPPVPNGLSELTLAQDTLIELFKLDKSLILASVKLNPEKAEFDNISDKELLSLINQIPKEEQQQILLKLLKGEANLSIKLNKCIKEFHTSKPKDCHRSVSLKQLREMTSSFDRIKSNVNQYS